MWAFPHLLLLSFYCLLSSDDCATFIVPLFYIGRTHRRGAIMSNRISVIRQCEELEIYGRMTVQYAGNWMDLRKVYERRKDLKESAWVLLGVHWLWFKALWGRSGSNLTCVIPLTQKYKNSKYLCIGLYQSAKRKMREIRDVPHCDSIRHVKLVWWRLR